MSPYGSDTGRGHRHAVVLGAGGHAKVVVDLLRRNGRWEPVAALDPDPALRGEDVLGVPVRGGDGRLSNFDPGDVVLVNGVGSIGDTTARRRVFERGESEGFVFPPIVHPAAYVAENTALGNGTQVMAGAVINPGARVEANVLVNTRSVIEHDCAIGEHSHIATGAVLSGGAKLGDGVHVGAGATIIQEVHIGSGTIVGAGAVVVDDLPPGIVAAGVPAEALDGQGDTRS